MEEQRRDEKEGRYCINVCYFSIVDVFHSTTHFLSLSLLATGARNSFPIFALPSFGSLPRGLSFADYCARKK